MQSLIMKKFALLFVVCAILIVSCDPPRDIKVNGLVKERKWSGYHTRTVSGMPGHDSGYNHIITDTVFAVTQPTYNIIHMPVPGLYLSFKGANDAERCWVYDSVGMQVMNDSLKYFYNEDSVVFRYYSLSPSPMYGMDAPYMEYIFLYSHK